ncbi:MAG TPA: serine hydrolase domain-containing protein [Symbiobacteriaceae bacterium]|nr:serine hydrolase domain-containing protein [Symbiobacteriaceae bacterium]
MKIVDCYLHEALETYRIPGLAVAVARHGEIVYAGGLGFRDVERGLPVTPETVFGVASVTKSFTCLAVMQLATEGRLSPFDPVVRWLPEFAAILPPDGAGVQVRHLMSHTSGLPGLRALYYARAGSIRRDPDWRRLGARDPFGVDPIRTVAELMALMAATEIAPLGPPGTVLNYSNEGYALLQAIIERAAGCPFRQYLQERLLDPLGMAHSTILESDLARFPEVTELYAPEPGGYFHSPAWWDVGDIYTNGSLKSTVLDLIRYLEVYRTGGAGIVPPAAVADMVTPVITMPTGTRYAYGLTIQPGYHGHTLIGHGGSIKGVSAQVMLVPEADLTVALLINVTGAPAERIALSVANAFLGLPLETYKYEFPAYTPAPGELDELAGTYHSDEMGAVEISTGSEGVTVKAAGQTIPVRPFARQALVSADGLTQVRGLPGAIFMGLRVYRRR